ncbi:MAG: CIA30 family protein [Pseudomonadota bacterium]
MAANAEPMTCELVSDLADPDESAAWQAVNDGVMGGRSSGGPSWQSDVMTFSGVINTNGGGFSSVRRDIEPGRMEGAAGLKLRLRGDGRTYRVTVRTAAKYRGRSINYQADLAPEMASEWSEVFVPFEAFRASVFGRAVPAPALDPSTAWSLGLILADGQDGPFTLDAAWIQACWSGEDPAA